MPRICRFVRRGGEESRDGEGLERVEQVATPPECVRSSNIAYLDFSACDWNSLEDKLTLSQPCPSIGVELYFGLWRLPCKKCCLRRAKRHSCWTRA